MSDEGRSRTCPNCGGDVLVPGSDHYIGGRWRCPERRADSCSECASQQVDMHEENIGVDDGDWDLRWLHTCKDCGHEWWRNRSRNPRPSSDDAQESVVTPARHVIEQEMAFTSWDRSCQDAAVTPEGSLRQCRRPAGHTDQHASGFGPNHRRWT